MEWLSPKWRFNYFFMRGRKDSGRCESCTQKSGRCPHPQLLSCTHKSPTGEQYKYHEPAERFAHVARAKKRTEWFKKYYGRNLSVLVLWSWADFLPVLASPKVKEPDYPTISLLIHVMIYDLEGPIMEIISEQGGKRKLSLNLNNASIDQKLRARNVHDGPSPVVSIPFFREIINVNISSIPHGVSNNNIPHDFPSNIFSCFFVFHSSMKLFPACIYVILQSWIKISSDVWWGDGKLEYISCHQLLSSDHIQYWAVHGSLGSLQWGACHSEGSGFVCKLGWPCLNLSYFKSKNSHVHSYFIHIIVCNYSWLQVVLTIFYMWGGVESTSKSNRNVKLFI